MVSPDSLAIAAGLRGSGNFRSVLTAPRPGLPGWLLPMLFERGSIGAMRLIGDYKKKRILNCLKTLAASLAATQTRSSEGL